MTNRTIGAASESENLTNDERKTKLKGETQWSQVGGDGPAAPKQPNERDESASSQAGSANNIGAAEKAAYVDATGSQQDTDRAPVTDEVYNSSVTGGKRTAPAPPTDSDSKR